MRKLLILGAGGHGQAVYEMAKSLKGTDSRPIYEAVAFLDDASPFAIGKIKDMSQMRREYTDAIAAIGNNAKRMELLREAERLGYRIPVLIHPEAYVSPSARIGEGTVVLPKAVVHTNVKTGKGCILSIGSLTEHDCILGDGVHIDCGAIVKGSSIQDGEKIPCGMIIENQKEETRGSK